MRRLWLLRRTDRRLFPMNMSDSGQSSQGPVTPQNPARPVAVITGGTRGIGLSIAQKLANEGYALALIYQRHHAQAREARDMLRRKVPVETFPVDVRHWTALQDTMSGIYKAWGPISLAVHNAASGVARPLLNTTLRHFDFTLEVNAGGLIGLAQAVVPKMTSSAHIIAISSLGARVSYPEYGLISASKAALEAIVRQLARELGSHHITVNAIAAGPIPSQTLSHFDGGQSWLQEFVEKVPMHQPLSENDVVQALWYLIQQKMINGQVLTVDGGFLTMA